MTSEGATLLSAELKKQKAGREVRRRRRARDHARAVARGVRRAVITTRATAVDATSGMYLELSGSLSGVSADSSFIIIRFVGMFVCFIGIVLEGICNKYCMFNCDFKLKQPK